MAGAAAETREFAGHILFVEEDHYVFPNAYRTVQALVAMKAAHCPECWAVNLAPSRPGFDGEFDERRGAVAEKMGFMGYAFNRTMWEALAVRSDDYCRFDDANWDVTVWAMLMEPLGALSMRATRTSAVHIGACGLHGNSHGNVRRNCTAGEDVPAPDVADEDRALWLDVAGGLVTRWIPKLKRTMFLGYGGWADRRDLELCDYISHMYRPRGAPAHAAAPPVGCEALAVSPLLEHCASSAAKSRTCAAV